MKIDFLHFCHKTFKQHYKAPHKFSSSNSNFQSIVLNGLRNVIKMKSRRFGPVTLSAPGKGDSAEILRTFWPHTTFWPYNLDFSALPNLI